MTTTPPRASDLRPALDLYAIAPTIFADDRRSVDGSAMREAAAWMASHGIRDLLVTGSYGEFQSLTDDERLEVLRAVRAAPGVRSVMACAALPSTDATVRLGSRMADEGADFVMVAAPLAAEVTPDDVVRHFTTIAESLPLPLVVYNNPVFGTDLSPEQLARIVELPPYRAVKQGTQSLRAIAASVVTVHEASSGRAKLLAASDLTAATALFAGADGLTSTNSWAFPQALARLVSAASYGDWELARLVADTLQPYFALARRLGQPRTVKAAMTVRGLPGAAVVRLPYAALSDGERAELETVLEKCDAALGELGSDSQGGEPG